MRCNSSAVSRTLQSKPKEDTREDCREQTYDGDGKGYPSIARLIKVFGRRTFLVRPKFAYTSISISSHGCE
jgi:hypothetical protein